MPYNTNIEERIFANLITFQLLSYDEGCQLECVITNKKLLSAKNSICKIFDSLLVARALETWRSTLKTLSRDYFAPITRNESIFE